jgi:hypothetical protein
VSEYQYYEFLAVERPLTAAEQAEVRRFSSRARITATSFTNEYHWGDFSGDPGELTRCCHPLCAWPPVVPLAVIDQHDVGVWRQLCAAYEMPGIDASRTLSTAGSREADLLSPCVIDYQAAQRVFSAC